MESSESKLYQTYKVQFPYKVSFSFPDDDHHTQITIESVSDVVRYGSSKDDIQSQMILDKEYGKPTYAKHLSEWVREHLWGIDPRDMTVTYGDNSSIERMSETDISEFIAGCLDE